MDFDKKAVEKASLKRVVKWIFLISIFAFLGKVVWDDWNQISEISLIIRPFPFILSIFIFALSYFIQVWAWYLITLKLGIALSIRGTFESWFYSQLGKYLPGKVWLLLERFYFYESKGKSKKLISTALYFEMVTMTLSGVIIFFASLFLFKKIPFFFQGVSTGWFYFLFLPTFFLLYPQLLEKIINWFLKRFNREPITLAISYLNILEILFVCTLAWLVGGVGFYLFIYSIYPIPSQYFLFFTGALAVSSTIGLIAFFAPAGIGVREGALVYLLTSLIPASIAVILSIITRLWMTFIEIGLIGVIYLLSRFRKEQ